MSIVCCNERRKGMLIMSANLRVVTILLTAITVLFSVGCGKPDGGATQVSAPPTLPGNWVTSLPPQFAGLSLKDGGSCFLDTVNGVAASSNPIPIKSGAPIAMVGWDVANLEAGTLGTLFGIQLNAPTPYFIAAEGFVRPGLGAALKNPALDGGGFKLDSTPLNVPAGDYRVLFFTQSGNSLLRCDTGRSLRVE
jgi:hypothetical protein